MPLEFLRTVAELELPLTVTDEGNIDKTRVLVAAGMITASLPEPGTGAPAQIHSVTGLGRATLKVYRTELYRTDRRLPAAGQLHGLMHARGRHRLPA
jgi:hypothetical protein